MKALLRWMVVTLLVVLSRTILRKYKPLIVMITGSVGKTSTKDAIAAALSERFYLRASEKSYNSEFGVPLTIIGASTPWNDAVAWGRVIIEGFALLLFPNHYPKLLVLEVGADKPGDMKKILKITSPDVVVVTRLPEVPVHVEAYEGPAEVRAEEFAPAYALAHGAPLILSSEDVYAREMARGIHASISTYGYGEDATVCIQDVSCDVLGEEPGMKATVLLEGKSYNVQAPGVLGEQQLYAPAAALAVADALDSSIADALKGLKSYTPPPGRARLLRGKHDSILIDDTYNSSPAAVEEAIKSLELVKTERRRVAILGDMLELGRYSAAQHERIGAFAAEHVDVLITVGTRAQAIATAFLNAGRDEGTVEGYENSVVAAASIANTIKEGDIVLIKGSQSVRMERIVEALLADEKDAGKLARQEGEWKKR
ncbi:MAG: UDP-N-acetylmuramoyl-tripeptide--D-alanyl-D-alanine ligase [Patescibacteria group bacterium]